MTGNNPQDSKRLKRALRKPKRSFRDLRAGKPHSKNHLNAAMKNQSESLCRKWLKTRNRKTCSKTGFVKREIAPKARQFTKN